MRKPRFSIVTCISRPDVYSKCILASVEETRGRHDVEIIPIYNYDNRYSASQALNLGLDVARGDHVVAVHQDVRLLDGWFNKLDAVIDGHNDYGVIGVAGISLDFDHTHIGKWGGSLTERTVAVGSVWDADDQLHVPPYWDGIKEPTFIHCADECLLVINRRTGLRFDPTFQGFHFYGADVCLQSRAAGYGVIGAELPIIHYGKHSGSFTAESRYWPYLRLLHRKWNYAFPELLGTHFHWTADGQFQLTSYIDMALQSGELSVHVKAIRLGEVRCK
jgi:glycosyltransferase involved in cell wall biosynthesis